VVVVVGGRGYNRSSGDVCVLHTASHYSEKE